MDLSRLAVVLCAFLLVICLVLSVSTLTVLRNAVDETNDVRKEAQELLADFQEQISKQVIATEPDKPDNAVPVDILYDTFCMRESGGKVAIYTADGHLIKILDIAVETLPQTDQEALREGIPASSWKEILTLIQDYTG